MQFLRGQQGATTIQQAILIALIVGAAFLSLDGLGLVASRTFSSTSTQLGGADTGRDRQLASVGPNDSSTGSETAAALNAPPASARSFLLRLVVLLIACPLGALCWYLLNRKEKKSAVEEELPLPIPQTESQIARDLVFDKRHNLLRLFNADIGMLMTSRIMVKHVMSEKVHSVLPSTSAQAIRDLMEEKRIRHVLVCDKANHLLGIITVRRVEDASGATAAELMERDPPTATPTSLLTPAITQIIKQRLYCLPVIRDDLLVGVLTSTDIMLALQCTLHALQKSANEVAADLPAGMVPGFMVALQSEAETEEFANA